jgi:hypothetical protein
VLALSAIETASRTALDDLRRMLGLLRAGLVVGEPGAGGGPPGLPVDQPRPVPVREGLVDATVAVVLAAPPAVDRKESDPGVGHASTAQHVGDDRLRSAPPSTSSLGLTDVSVPAPSAPFSIRDRGDVLIGYLQVGRDSPGG